MIITNNPTEQQATPTSEEELDEILDNITEFLYFKNADGEFVPVNFKDSPVFKEDRDAIMQLLQREVEKAKLETISLCQLKITQMLDPSGDTKRELALVSVLE
jgi:hypothetical protein